jgi:uncharacterized protein YkwD/uncharacterized membrane protein required for colicin V production
LIPTDLNLNAVDLAVLGIILLYALGGLHDGWLLSVVELAGFVVALLAALALYAPAARQLMVWTPLPYGLAKPAAFLLLWVLADLIYGTLARGALGKHLWRRQRGPIDRLLGLWPGAARGLLVATVLLMIGGTLPFPEPIAGAYAGSRFRQALEPRAAALAGQFTQVFGEAVQETLGLLTVRPHSNERVDLPFTVAGPGIDTGAESRMLELLNAERTARGLQPLRPDETIRDVARGHSRDMFERGYFAHVDPDGDTPFERMREGGVRFRAAGENLALAPTVEVAHNGLMNSPGHRENILNPAYGRVGIGVLDGGLHGKMFTQNFAD